MRYIKIERILCEKGLNAHAVIPIVEDMIKMEETSKEANKLLRNTGAYMENEYRITHAEMLLCLLRKHSGL